MPKICEFENCRKYANYGEYHSKPIRCKEHKEEYKLVSQICVHPGCKTRPIYNIEGETTALYCSTHKLDNMINVISKTCVHPGCKTIPHYNIEGETTALYCSKHKLDNMINVKSKTCVHPGCKTIPHYNIEGETTALYCSTHKLDNMINVISKTCKANYCLGTRASSKYKDYCASCYQQLFPNDPLTLQVRAKTKEIAVRDFINLNFEGFQHDAPLWTGNCDCTHRRRIDHRKLIGNTLLCIETDENQHKGYDVNNEEIRYDDLYMLHGGKFIFIRFNPDKFKNKAGKNLNPMLYTRLPVLKEEIERQIKKIEKEENIELLEIIKLYYDE
jgi:hypothetical protein